MRIIKYFILVILAITTLCRTNANDNIITTDSRIRTFIYNKNDIYRIVIHYNYQTSIEFEEGENIETISSGNNYAWQITPAKNRIFIKPLEENILTNMTIITNKRTYYLEVQSKPYTNSFDNELIYVVRFHVPKLEEKQNNIPKKTTHKQEVENINLYNFNFDIKGKAAISPVTCYDDGVNTYLQFKEDVELKGSSVKVYNNERKKMVKIIPKIAGDYMIVPEVTEKIHIALTKGEVIILNNNSKH